MIRIILENCTGGELDLEAPTKEIYKFTRPPIQVDTKLISVDVCSVAFSTTNNLIACSYSASRFTQPEGYSIFTVEGYYVTSFRLDSWKFRSVKFTEHSFITAVMQSLGRNNPSFLTLCRVSDYNVKTNNNNLYNLKEKHRIEFLDCDNAGNIYTNSSKTNEIAIYNSDLEFQRTLCFPTVHGKIYRINIRDDCIVVLESSSRVHARRPGADYPLFIHKFRLSTEEPSITMLNDTKYFRYPPLICLDKYYNILVFNRDNSLYESTRSVRESKEPPQVKVCVCNWNIGNNEYSLKDHEVGYNYRRLGCYAEMAMTDDCQLILIMNNGVFLTYNVI